MKLGLHWSLQTYSKTGKRSMFPFGFFWDEPQFVGWKEQNEKLQIFQGLRSVNECLRCKNLSQKWHHRSHWSPWTQWLSSCESLYQCPWSLLVTASLVLLAPLLKFLHFGVYSFPAECGDFLSPQRWEMKSWLPPELGCSAFLWWSQRRDIHPVHFLT